MIESGDPISKSTEIKWKTGKVSLMLKLCQYVWTHIVIIPVIANSNLYLYWKRISWFDSRIWQNVRRRRQTKLGKRGSTRSPRASSPGLPTTRMQERMSWGKWSRTTSGLTPCSTIWWDDANISVSKSGMCHFRTWCFLDYRRGHVPQITCCWWNPQIRIMFFTLFSNILTLLSLKVQSFI